LPVIVTPIGRVESTVPFCGPERRVSCTPHYTTTMFLVPARPDWGDSLVCQLSNNRPCLTDHH